MPGINEVKLHLEEAWRAGKLSHAYIVSGGTGDMRREVADRIATLLLAYRSPLKSQSAASDQGDIWRWDGMPHQPEDESKASGGDAAEPVQETVWAKQLASGTHPDLIRVTHEKPASISVDDIRLQLSDTIDIRPYETESKLYIIDEAEKMTVQAQNAVLKTIEEPPEYACIALLTENPEVFLETIRSRCVNLKLSDEGEDGQISQEHVRILRSLTQPRVRDTLDAVTALKDDKDGILAFIDATRMWLRDALVLKATGDVQNLLLTGESENVRAYAKAVTLADIERSLKALDEAESRIGSNVNTELTLQLLLMELGIKTV